MRSFVVLSIVLSGYGLARAQAPTGEATDSEKADKIFEQAQQLKQAGKTAQACAKYDEALRYNQSAVGTLLNVALCAEESNRLSTALVYFTQARDLAREHNLTEHRVAAEEHIAKIEPLVPHLSIAFAEILTDTKLVIDDKVHPITGANDIRVDPGTRHIVVTAPGRLPFETTVDVKAQQKQTVEIPKLKSPVTVSRGRRTVGKIITISGGALVLTGIGVVFAADLKYQGELDNGNCQGSGKDVVCNPQGYKTTSNARTLGTVGTVVGITGLVAAGVGAYFWFFAPNDAAAAEHASVTFAPTVSPDGAGVAAVGRF
jgi:hypothetical protein